ncbi:MAG: carbon-nitrogen hydrolase family protein [Anaerolineales bacterium]|nr:carbon-nitrogen hydrolase family protein [Anaerolineales bacterium]
MKVTVTQFPDAADEMEAAFEALAAHVAAEGSDLVLLPEMPFHPWLCYEPQPDAAAWQASADAHAKWLPRLGGLGAPLVLGSRAVTQDGGRYNDGFIWQGGEASFAHRKYYLPDEAGFWEASWYGRNAEPRFEAAQAGDVKVGFMICSDLWFGEHARGYARQRVHLLVNPRATEKRSVDKWIAGGRVMGVMAGAYCLSSNRSGQGRGFEWGGAGWVSDPDGEVLAVTSAEQPFVTVEIDSARAEAAKATYPRDVRE